ncbi:MAG: hypothetical protein ACO3RM_07910 [Paracoccaceae bacterium]
MIKLSQYRDRDNFLAVRTLGNYWNNLADGAVPPIAGIWIRAGLLMPCATLC